MAEIVACPRCQRKLHVPAEYLGQKVQCPECQHTFTAAPTSVSAQPIPSSTPSTPPAGQTNDERRRRDDDRADYDSRARPDRYDDDDEDDEFDRVRRRRYAGNDCEPHRGGLILALGLIALIGGWTCGVPLLIGPIAWYMGSADLREIRAGRMDRAGESSTRSGQVCGMISTILLIIGAVVICLAIAADARRF